MPDEWQSSVVQFPLPQTYAAFRERIQTGYRRGELIEKKIVDSGGGEHTICKAAGGWYGFELTADSCLLWFQDPGR
jgi:hypothetical protein